MPYDIVTPMKLKSDLRTPIHGSSFACTVETKYSNEETQLVLEILDSMYKKG